MKRIRITYTVTGHHGEKETLSTEISFADDIARNLLKKQEESIFLTGENKYGALPQWLNLLAMLQGFSRAKFESAEEVK